MMMMMMMMIILKLNLPHFLESKFFSLILMERLSEHTLITLF